ncbi:PREDICTED: purple acid phosphatase 4-like [Camelina sativa]|uniref:Purple acid phosphatase n=1 Tax=Camelina sativa TaxID=90675 RepID=A0ABM0VSB8_CAMSA|nr:PREDICTED: purple acid phosphatase 4-like [Camelina sativa]
MHSRLIKIYVAFYHIKLGVQKNRMGSKFDIGGTVMTLLLCFLLLSIVPKLEAELTTVEHAPNPDGSISFLVIGDWGRRGLYNQSQVARQMGRIGEKMDIDFVVSTGDNIYDSGMKSIDDPAFQLSFTNIYTSPSLQKPWYSVLGNHDYRGDVEAQLSPVLKSIDSRWTCMRSFIVDAEIVELFFVDTTPFVDAYFLDPQGQTYDWSEVSPRESYIQTTLTELEMGLRESRANWKIVVGHHAIKSASIHGNTKELESLLLPILEANKVDLYMNGHDHCLQHIRTSQSPIQFLTSGGGSKAWRGYYNWTTPEDMKFFYDGQGFMSVMITRAEMGIAFYDVSGNILHKWDTSKMLDTDFYFPL